MASERPIRPLIALIHADNSDESKPDGSCVDAGRAAEFFQTHWSHFLQIAEAELDHDLRGKADACDLVQQTFLEANRDLAGFRGKTKVELFVWLRRILLNNVRNLRRHFRAIKRDVRREVSLTFAHVLTRRSREPLWTCEEIEIVARALTHLPRDYRQAIELRHQGRRSFQEIGALLGRSAEAARKLCARAIERLQTQLGHLPRRLRRPSKTAWQ